MTLYKYLQHKYPLEIMSKDNYEFETHSKTRANTSRLFTIDEAVDTINKEYNDY